MNGIRLLCDTNPLIYLLNGNMETAEYLDGKQLWISVITELELFGKQNLNKNEIKEINALVDNCFVAELNPQIKQITKNLMQEKSVKLPDAIIAATSVYLDIPLLTFDAGFEKLDDIKLILLEL
ncbi:MAG: PIN domain-containing protein [Bacteroidales bacterium]|nr:PIN domain-containing protein [Bacteroidales bacterium]MCF8352334.1 PIN domain-containing protein [Bacteroidales bacterium]MCF8377885.1 PIN domain-containing protein [Bacteroidales bacterium]